MKNEAFLQKLGNCITHCNYCADACLGEDNVQKMVKCIRLDRACAEVCSTLHQLLSTEFDDVDDLVRYCKRICDACANECDKHNHDHCKACADACRKCTEACEAYLA